MIPAYKRQKLDIEIKCLLIYLEECSPWWLAMWLFDAVFVFELFCIPITGICTSLAMLLLLWLSKPVTVTVLVLGAGFDFVCVRHINIISIFCSVVSDFTIILNAGVIWSALCSSVSLQL